MNVIEKLNKKLKYLINVNNRNVIAAICINEFELLKTQTTNFNTIQILNQLISKMTPELDSTTPMRMLTVDQVIKGNKKYSLLIKKVHLSGGGGYAEAKLYSAYGDNKDGAVTQKFFTEKVQRLEDTLFPFKFLYFNGGGTFEKGSVQNIDLTWEYDREIESQSLNEAKLPVKDRSASFNEIVNDITYTITALSNKTTISKSVAAMFKLKKYYGVSEKESLTNDDILALKSDWAQRQQGVTTYDCTGGKYVYYVLPTSMTKDIEFWINGLRNTDWDEIEIGVTNASGHTDNYTIFKLHNKQTGILKIEVR